MYFLLLFKDLFKIYVDLENRIKTLEEKVVTKRSFNFYV